MLLRPHPRLLLAAITPLIGAWLLPGPANGQCVDYSDYLHWTAGLPIYTQPRDIQLVGDYAYIADEGRGLLILDISDPTAPRVVGEEDTPDDGAGIAISGSHAFVAAESSGLQVFDISDPSAPTIVGFVDTPDNALGVAISGNHAFVADDETGLIVVDISDPTLPVLVTTLDTPGQAEDLMISGNLAYVADGTSGLQVVDISDPTAPEIIGAANVWWTQDVFVLGSRAYLVAGGVTIVDVSDPTNPTELGRIPSNRIDGVTVAGQTAYAVGNDGLTVIDVADPSNPFITGALDTSPGECVAVTGNYAILGGISLSVVNIANSASPNIVGATSISGGDLVNDVALAGNLAFLSGIHSTQYGVTGSLSVVDVTDPTQPDELVTTFFDDGMHTVAADGGYVYVGSSYGFASGFQVYDVSTPSSPTAVASVDVYARDITLDGQHAYVGGPDGLWIIDIADPTSPAIIGSLGTMDTTGAVAVAGDFAYIVFGWDGFQVVDISDRTTPTVVGQVETPGRPLGVAVDGPYAYVASGTEGLRVIDVSDPTAPVIVGHLGMPSKAHDVSLSGRFAYVSVGERGLHIVDVGNPSNPEIVGGIMDPLTEAFGGGAVSLALAGDVAFVADRFQGLKVIAIQCEDPVSLTLSGFSAVPTGRAVHVSWVTAHESSHDGFNLYRSGQLDTGFTRLNDQLLRGRSPYVYVDAAVLPSATYYYKVGAVDTHGREILYATAAATTPADIRISTVFRRVSPNPFRTETTLGFTLANRQDVTLEIFDVTGRLVREVMRGPLPGGEHSVRWDGRDGAERRVAGGTYFVRFAAGGESRTQKVVFLGD